MIGNKQAQKTSISSILAKKQLDGDGSFWQKKLEQVKAADVERILSEPQGKYSLDKLLILISPVAQDYLEDMARLARQLTIQRFGRTIKLYSPLYLSNYCVNSCVYCGFNYDNKTARKRLTIDQAISEAEIIASKGFKDILLVSSEDKQYISVDYLCQLSHKLRGMFSSIAVEVYQMSTDEYAQLFKAGIEGVTLYQETYNRQAYKKYHQAGPKADYDNRLNTPDAIASAGMREVGLGVLLGLCDWRSEILALAEHANYLMKQYWQSHVSISFPRLRPACNVADQQFEHLVSDKDLVQMITALRLCFADAGLVLSTRESSKLRDHLVHLGITKISAASKTSPGGYSGNNQTTKQFEIDDNRTALEVADMIRKKNLEPVWKDWDKAFLEN